MTVRIASSNPSFGVVAPDASTVGAEFLDVFIPNGETIRDFVVQSVSPTATGTVEITASAAAFADGVLAVPLVAPVLSISGFGDRDHGVVRG